MLAHGFWTPPTKNIPRSRKLTNQIDQFGQNGRGNRSAECGPCVERSCRVRCAVYVKSS